MSLSDPFLVQSLGAALLAFVPQGLVLWAVTAAALAALRRASPDVRYAVALLALGCCFAVFALTFWSVLQAGPLIASAAAGRTESAAPAGVAAGMVMGSAAVPRAVADSLPASWALALSLAWSLGASLTGVRMGLAWWWMSRRLRREATPLDAAWTSLAARHLRRLGIASRVRLVAWSEARSPFVVGWLRPVVVFPVAVIAGLPVDQVELLLLHELIHIRRADPLVNQLQLAAEALFFFHPAVRWISRRIRTERELCCDAAVCRISGHSSLYAEALARTVQVGTMSPASSVAAAGGDLARRLRLLIEPHTPARSSLQAAGAIAALVFSTVGWTWWSRPAAAPTPTDIEVVSGIEAGPFVRRESHSRRASFGHLRWQTYTCPDAAQLTVLSVQTGPYALRIAARGISAPAPEVLASTGTDQRATLVLEETTWTGRRRFVMRRSGDAPGVWTTTDRDGRERAAEPNERAHAIELLDGLWARTGFLAAERGRQAAAQGVAALGRALAGVRDDFARAEMVIAAYQERRPEQQDLIRLAAARVRTSVELGRVLRVMADSGSLEHSSWGVWTESVRRIGAPEDREITLRAAAAGVPAEWSTAFLAEIQRLPDERRAAVMRVWNARRI